MNEIVTLISHYLVIKEKTIKIHEETSQFQVNHSVGGIGYESSTYLFTL